MRDSAGVVLVENHRPDWADGRAWFVDSTPELVIGGANSGDLFDIRGMARLSDGRVIVANGGTGELQAYSRDGRLQAVLARHGPGPSELHRLVALWKYGPDSLLALDMNLGRGRLLVFDPHGTFVRAWTIVSPSGESRSVHPVTVAPDGSMLMSTSTTLEPSPEVALARNQETVYRYSASGEAEARLGEFPGPLSYRHGAMRLGDVSFTTGTLFAASRTWWFSLDPATAEIRRHRWSGSVERIIRLPLSRLPVSQRHIELEIARRRADLETLLGSGPPTARALLREQEAMLREMPFPDSFPPYTRVLTDTHECLWVQRYTPIGQNLDEWMMLDATGRWLSTLRAPDGLQVYEVGDNYVLGVRKDALDVEYVELHGLVRGGSCRGG